MCVLATHLLIDNVLTLGEIVHRPRSLFGEGLKPSALARAMIEQIAVGLEPDAPAEAQVRHRKGGCGVKNERH